jgi:hypothetical protein
MSLVDIAVADLRLDGENPRHDPTKGEQKIIAALMADFGHEIIVLAKDIAANGLSPIDPLMVVQDGTTYTVIEGNRRLTAVRLLADPSLAPTPADRTAFAVLAKKVTVPVTSISCHVELSRAAAWHWQELRHRGQADGAGVMPWNPEAINRSFGVTSRTTSNAIRLADAIKVAYPKNKDLLADLAAVMKTNSSTLGRLIGDTKFREGLGIVLKPFGSHYSSADLEPVLMRLLADWTGPHRMKVKDVYDQDQKVAYLGQLAPLLPAGAQRHPQASPLKPVKTAPPPLPPRVAAPTAAAPAAPTGTPPSAPPTTPGTAAPSAPLAAAPIAPTPPAKPTPAGPRHLFEGVRLPKFGVRVQNVLGEVQDLDVDRKPNASAVLMRVLIDLAVEEVFDRNSWSKMHPLPAGTPADKKPKDKFLVEMVRECLDHLDPSGKDKKWKVVRVELDKPHGLFAMSTLNAYTHDWKFNPIPKDLRLTSANYAEFLAALDGLLP